MDNDTITLQDVLTDVLLDIVDVLSSGDLNTSQFNTIVDNDIDGPWAPAEDFNLEHQDSERTFWLTLRRTWCLSPTNPLGQLTTLEDIGAAYRMVRRDNDLSIIHRLPPDDRMPNPHPSGTVHHRLWETHYSLEGARLGLARLEAEGWPIRTWRDEDEDDDEEACEVTLEYTTTLAVLGNDEDDSDCEYVLRLDLPASVLDDVFHRIAAGSDPDDALCAVTGGPEVVVLD